MCGEQYMKGFDMRDKSGSPPRVRGTASGSEARADMAGITPACAGNSALVLDPDFVSWDHPRVCGEQALTPFSDKSALGSPPRVRGTVLGFVFKDGVGRITPACAGNSNSGLHMGQGVWDHPRVCGEQEKN